MNNFVYPLGAYNNAIINTTAKYYSSSPAGVYLNAGDLSNINLYHFKRFPVPLSITADIDTYKVAIDSIDNNGGWLVFMVHDVTTNNATILGDIIDYVKSKNIPILRVNDVIPYIERLPPENAVPMTPASIAVVGDYNKATLTWDTQVNIDSFYIYRGLTTSPTTQIATVAGNQTTYEDSALAAGIYFYRIKAKNDLGFSSYTSSVTDTVFWQFNIVAGTSSYIIDNGTGSLLFPS